MAGVTGVVGKQWSESSAGPQSSLCTPLRPFALLFPEWKGAKPTRVQSELICGGHMAVWPTPALPWPAKPEMGIREACHDQPQQLNPLQAAAAARNPGASAIPSRRELKMPQKAKT